MTGKRMLAVAIATASLAVVAGAVVRGAVFQAWGLGFLQIAGPADVAMAGLAVLLAALPGLGAMVAGLWWWRGRGSVAAMLCLVGALALYALVVRPAQAAAQHGFFGQPGWVIDGGTGGCATARVFWAGQNAVVYQCVAAGDRRFRVSFDRPSMTLLPARQAGEVVHRM